MDALSQFQMCIRRAGFRPGMFLLMPFLVPACCFSQGQFDLLLQNGHVIDAKNHISAVRDLAIRDGKIAVIAEHIDTARALKVVDVRGLYVTPGLVDIHVHAYAGTGERASYAGDYSLYPDGFTLRSGVTTVADAGSSGWRNFEDFKQRVIDRSKTRVLAFLNIVGNGMRGPKFENDLADMEAQPAAAMALKYKGLIVGIKTAHYQGPEWTPVEHAVEAGTIADIPVMVDFGANRPERPIGILLTQKLRPGDIYTHVYSGLRNEQDESGHVNPALWAGRKRGVIFDVGHGNGSFVWGIAVPAIREGFRPDSISSDLHAAGMNNDLKDMLNLASKFLAMGLTIDDVIARSTWNPAHEIHQDQLGNLSIGSPADIAVLRLQSGDFGFTDMYGARLKGDKRLVCELTVHDGKVVYDLNGITRPDWKTLPTNYRQTGDPLWDGLHPKPRQQISEVPQARISNGLISADLYLPDPARGYYRATRFDWSGVISSLQYKSHSFFGQWFERYDPKLHDAIMGPVEEFLSNRSGLGYEEARPGEKFVKIGVGAIRKPEEPRFQQFNTYEIVDPGRWTVNVHQDSVEFEQVLTDTNGYAYVYRKVVKLLNDKPQLVLEHTLKNTGRRVIDTSVYEHNFYMLDNQPTGPDFDVRFPFDVRLVEDVKALAEARGKEIAFLKPLDVGQSVYTHIEGFGASSKDYDIRVENRKSRVGVRQTGDRPLETIAFWSIKTTVCPEAYIHLRIEPGREKTWRIAYEFYTIP